MKNADIQSEFKVWQPSKREKTVANLKGEMWKQYRDTDVFVSTCGRVKRVYKNCERLLTPFKKIPKKGSWYMLVKVNNKATKVSKMIWEAFNGKIPDGYAVAHRNKHQGDNSLVNLELMTLKQLGLKHGGRNSRRKLVYDIDNQVVYKGTREASEKLHISRQTVSDYCNKKVKKPVVRIRWFEEK